MMNSDKSIEQLFLKRKIKSHKKKDIDDSKKMSI